MRTLIIALIFLLAPLVVFAREAEPERIGPMDVIKYNTSSYETVGYVVEETDDYVTVIPERGGRLKIKRELIKEIVYASEEPKWITTDEMIKGFTSELLKLVEERTTFRVAKVSDSKVYLNTGKGVVDRRGWKANIYREGDEITDPVTGEALGYAKNLVGTVQIIGETDTYAEALPVGTDISAFQEGDVGVFLRKKPTLAVADLTTVDGKKSPYGAMVSEGIIGELTKSKDLQLVERKQIDKLLEELAGQQTLLDLAESDVVSDSSTLSEMSKLEGADALLVGTVAIAKGKITSVTRDYNKRDVTKEQKGTVSLRIVHTKTGVVLYSARYLVSYLERPYRVEGDAYRGGQDFNYRPSGKRR